MNVARLIGGQIDLYGSNEHETYDNHRHCDDVARVIFKETYCMCMDLGEYSVVDSPCVTCPDLN